MANLGGFAGGLAQGIQNGMNLYAQKRRLDLDEQEQQQRTADRAADRSMRERELGMREKEFNWKNDERERAEILRGDVESIFNESYGAAGEDGKVRQLGDDPIYDFRVGIKMEQAKMRHLGVKPEDVMKLAEYGSKVRSSEYGKLLEGALGGDPNALAKLGAAEGFDPSTAKLVVDPVRGIYQLQTDKGVRDLTNIARTYGAIDFVKARKEQTKDVRDTQTFDLGVREKEGNIRKNEVEVNEVLPARAAAARSQAAESRAGIDDKKAGAEEKRARAKVATAEAENLGKGLTKSGKDPDGSARTGKGKLIQPDTIKEFSSLSKGAKIPDPEDSKQEWADARDFVRDRFAKHRGSSKDGMEAFTKATKEKNEVMKLVDADVEKVRKALADKATREKIVSKYGTANTKVIRKALFNQYVSRIEE